MAESAIIGQPMYNEVGYNYGTVNSIDGRAHIKIEGIPFIIAHDPFSGRHSYGRDEAPAFVSKFGSGDPTYRDSSFFPHWVQMNFRNGAKQDEWDDEGRFFTSQNVDITDETKLTLSKLLTSLELVAGSVDVTCWAIDYSDSRKVMAGTSNGHIWRWDPSSEAWSDMGDVTAVGGGTAGRRVNCLIFSKIGLDGARATGEGQVYAGVGTPAGTGGTNAAQIYRYDGTWASAATFASRDAVTAMCEFNSTMYAALGGVAEIQEATNANLTTWTVSKNIDYPGYIWSMVVYNQRLYCGGGHPENAPTNYQLGTLWSYDGYLWSEVAPFNGTVIRSLCVYDNLLFIGTIHGQLYVYNRANIDLLYEMPDDNAIYDMIVYDDKLYMVVSYRGSDNQENSIYIFDRAGTHKAHYDAAINPLAILVYGDDLFIGTRATGAAYKIDKTKYSLTGELQSSYFNANLPNIDKVWFDVSIEMDAMPADCTVAYYYKTDDSVASWTKVDETSEEGKLLAKFSFPDGVYSKKLSYKITLTTTDNTKTPTIRKILTRYVVQPDFKYLWKFKVSCPDNLEWLDETSPTSPLAENTTENGTQVLVNDSTGFPDPGGEKMYAVIENLETGEKNEIYYTGKTGNYLTGCGSVQAHDVDDVEGNWQVSIQGRHFHRKILELKQRKAIVQFIDIDSIVYKVLMYNYAEDGFVINQTDGLENEVGITLLQA